MIPVPYNSNYSNTWLNLQFPTKLRALPTITSSSWNGGNPAATYANTDFVSFNFTGGATYYWQGTTTMSASAEL